MAYIKVNTTGRVIAYASPGFQLGPDAIDIDIPDGFAPATAGDWVLKDGALVYDPASVVEAPAEPTLADRLASVEAELASYKAAYEEGVGEAWA